MPERELPGGYTKKNKEKASHVMEKGNNLVMDSCIGSTESTKKMRGIA
jgi:predicted CoA-binding protein